MGFSASATHATLRHVNLGVFINILLAERSAAEGSAGQIVKCRLARARWHPRSDRARGARHIIGKFKPVVLGEIHAAGDTSHTAMNSVCSPMTMTSAGGGCGVFTSASAEAASTRGIALAITLRSSLFLGVAAAAESSRVMRQLKHGRRCIQSPLTSAIWPHRRRSRSCLRGRLCFAAGWMVVGRGGAGRIVRGGLTCNDALARRRKRRGLKYGIAGAGCRLPARPVENQRGTET